MAEFNLNSSFVPQGDQPQAIDNLVKGLNENDKHQVLLAGFLKLIPLFCQQQFCHFC